MFSKFKEYLVNNVSLIWIACLTLGLAPFTPPHIYQKLVYIFQGSQLDGMDWFDVAVHGTPWVLLILSYIYRFTKKKSPSE